MSFSNTRQNQPQRMMGFKRGDLVSVWHRDSSRHKWPLELGLVRILMIGEGSATVQTSQTGKYQPTPNGLGAMVGATSFSLRALPGDKWQRELRKPIFITSGGPEILLPCLPWRAGQ